MHKCTSQCNSIALTNKNNGLNLIIIARQDHEAYSEIGFYPSLPGPCNYKHKLGLMIAIMIRFKPLFLLVRANNCTEM